MKTKTLSVRRGSDGSIHVDPSTMYQVPGVLRQLEATVRVAKKLGLTRETKMQGFNEYQQKAAEFAVYGKDYRTIYPALGLCNEAGEVAGKIKKLLRGDSTLADKATKEAIAAELGDVLWYLSVLAYDLEINLEDIATNNIAKLTDRAARGVIRGNGDTR